MNIPTRDTITHGPDHYDVIEQRRTEDGEWVWAVVECNINMPIIDDDDIVRVLKFWQASTALTPTEHARRAVRRELWKLHRRNIALIDEAVREANQQAANSRKADTE